MLSCFLAGGGTGHSLVCLVSLTVLWSVVMFNVSEFPHSVGCSSHQFLFGGPYRVLTAFLSTSDGGAEGIAMSRQHLSYHW